MSSHPTPPSSEAASQNHSEPDHKKGHATVGAAQLIALGKAMGDAQSEKIEILTQQTEIFIQQIDTLIQQIENFIQRLREHDTRIMNAGDEQLSDISRSSTQDQSTGVGAVMYRIDRFVICVAVSIAEVFVVFELVGQLLWLAVRNRLEYGTLITVEEWGPIVLVWIPVGLGVVLAIGKFLYFKPEARSG